MTELAHSARRSRALLVWAVISILLLGAVAVFDAHERSIDRARVRADARVQVASSNSSACTLRKVRELAAIGQKRASAAAVDPAGSDSSRARNAAQAIETQAFLNSTPIPVTIPRGLDCSTLLAHTAREATRKNGAPSENP